MHPNDIDWFIVFNYINYNRANIDMYPDCKIAGYKHGVGVL